MSLHVRSKFPLSLSFSLSPLFQVHHVYDVLTATPPRLTDDIPNAHAQRTHLSSELLKLELFVIAESQVTSCSAAVPP